MTVTQLKVRVPLSRFAEALGCSERWLKYRVAEGMPSEIIAGRRKVIPMEAEQWLEKEGHIVRSER
jgi:DNA-binding Lrp family transcriptional regulator